MNSSCRSPTVGGGAQGDGAWLWPLPEMGRGPLKSKRWRRNERQRDARSGDTFYEAEEGVRDKIRFAFWKNHSGSLLENGRINVETPVKRPL